MGLIDSVNLHLISSLGWFVCDFDLTLVLFKSLDILQDQLFHSHNQD